MPGRRVSANAAVTNSTETTSRPGPTRNNTPSAPCGALGPVPDIAAIPVAPAEIPTPTPTRIIELAHTTDPLTPRAPAQERPARRSTTPTPAPSWLRVMPAPPHALPTAPGVGAWIRIATAVGASGVVPIALALVGDLFPFAQRGRALGWLFGGMAGGIAVGAAGGALAEPVIGWRGLFLAAAAGGLVLFLVAVGTRSLPVTSRPATVPPLRAVAAGYRGLLRDPRGRRTYSYVLINAVLQSGVYTWLGLYLTQRFGLGELGIGLTLLGYGIPGFLLGPLIGRVVDRYGRARIIPAGVALGAVCALLLAVALPRIAVQATVVALSPGLRQSRISVGQQECDWAVWVAAVMS